MRVASRYIELHMDVVHQSTGRCNSLGSMAVSPRPRVKWNMKTKHNAVDDLIFESSDHFLGILFFETKHTYTYWLFPIIFGENISNRSIIIHQTFWISWSTTIVLNHLPSRCSNVWKNVHGTICLIFNLCINQWKGSMKKKPGFFGQYLVFFDYARNTWQLFFHLKKSRYKVQ